MVSESLHIRVQWFSTFFRFYDIGAFHDLDLLVLRPLKKKKVFRAPPTEGTGGKIFIFQKIEGTLQMNISSENLQIPS